MDDPPIHRPAQGPRLSDTRAAVRSRRDRRPRVRDQTARTGKLTALHEQPVVIVGAGAAGLGTAGELGARGLPAVVLDRASVVGSAWRHRYDSLSLNTSRSLSRLPRFRHQRGRGHWMHRDEFVAYLQRYAR